MAKRFTRIPTPRYFFEAQAKINSKLRSQQGPASRNRATIVQLSNGLEWRDIKIVLQNKLVKVEPESKL